jgi:hypothetical protein
MRTLHLTLTLAGVAALTTACGGGATTPATGALKSTASPTPRVRNVDRGEVVQVKDSVVTLTARDGTDTDFDLTPATQVNEQQDASITDVVVGVCAFGFGQRLSPDLVAAQVVIIGAHGPKGESDCRRGGGGQVGHTGLAGGQVTAVDGQTYTVTSVAGPQQFKVGLSTKVSRLVTVPASSLAAGQCVTATGPRDGTGTVQANRVVISPASVSGCFAPGTNSGTGTGGGGGGAGGG